MSKVNDSIVPAVPQSVWLAAAKACVKEMTIQRGIGLEKQIENDIIYAASYRYVRAAIESAYRAGVESVSPKPIHCKHCGEVIAQNADNKWYHSHIDTVCCYLSATPED